MSILQSLCKISAEIWQILPEFQLIRNPKTQECKPECSTFSRIFCEIPRKFHHQTLSKINENDYILQKKTKMQRSLKKKC